MASRANWAKMTSTTGGSASLTLSSVSGFPTFAQAFGTGETSIEYVIEASNTREAGIANYNGTTHVLSGRVVTQAWDGASYGTAALNIPTSGVSIYCAPIHQRVAEVDPATGALLSPLGSASVTATTIPDGEIPPEKLADGTLQTVTELQDALGVPNTDGKECDLLITLYGVANGTYDLDPKASWPYTIDSLVLDSKDNTATATVKINGTNVTSLADVSVTTNISDTAATAANTVAAGAAVTITLADISTTADLVGKLRVTRG